MNPYVFYLNLINYNREKTLYSSPKIMASAYPVFNSVEFALASGYLVSIGNLGGQLKSRYDDARSEK